MSSLPEFDKNGNLPPGIYKPNIDEVYDRFRGENNLVRASRTRNLIEFIEFITSFAVVIYIDGSYITKKLEPSDVDLAVLLPRDFKFESKEGRKLNEYTSAKDFFHLDIFVYVEGIRVDNFNERVEGWMTDRAYNPKGILYLEINP